MKNKMMWSNVEFSWWFIQLAMEISGNLGSLETAVWQKKTVREDF
jgi:hypothetical protein